MSELTTDQALGFIADMLCMCNGTLEDKHVNGCPQYKVAKDWLMQVQREAKIEELRKVAEIIERTHLSDEYGNEGYDGDGMMPGYVSIPEWLCARADRMETEEITT